MSAKHQLWGVSLTAALTLGVAGNTLAVENVELPRTLVWTTYETGTSLNAQANAIGNLLRENGSSTLRVLPSRSDVARLLPVRQGRADYTLTGMSIYYAQEGLEDFNEPNWGPQPVGILLAAQGVVGFGVIVAADSDIQHPRDLAGKRVSYISGQTGINSVTEANLAFGGLGWDDVTRVEYSSYTATFDGFTSNDVDAIFMVSASPLAARAESSPRGMRWLHLDADEPAGWDQAQQVLPYYEPITLTRGAGISEDAPWHGGSYPLPVLITYLDHDDDEAYHLTRFIFETYDTFKDMAPGARGYNLDNHNLQQTLPIHAGAVRYYRERGVWSQEDEAHNQRMLERQQVLQNAWEGLRERVAGTDALMAKWPQAREQALQDAGF
ncbi:MAG: TAXI family TRAP transporter solute-binding subunit [Ectothiorhodospiraceae bacterium]|nr:TAXI family TRAP transporter solute-binding subunit [Ectothiorhodospiraceae bacterium]